MKTLLPWSLVAIALVILAAMPGHTATNAQLTRRVTKLENKVSALEAQTQNLTAHGKLPAYALQNPAGCDKNFAVNLAYCNLPTTATSPLPTYAGTITS